MEANIEIAQSLFKNNKYQETIDTCNELLATNSNSIEALKLIAKSFLATRKIEDARLFLNKLLNLELIDFVANIINMHRIRKVLESKSNTEDDKVAVLEAQLAQAKQIA